MQQKFLLRRLVASVVVVGLLGIVAWLVLSGGAKGSTTAIHGNKRGASTTTRPPAGAAPATRSTQARPTVQPPLRGMAVTMAEIPLIDTSRKLVNGGVVLASQRNLPTYVWTPTAPGAYPLVVFVHGYNIGPLQYQRFCSTLASSGYVVAAPSFPLEDPSRGNGLSRADLPNEAIDVAFVITSLEANASANKIQLSRIAVIGHSDGADVALLVGYERGTVDSRVLAIVSDAPDPITSTTVPSSVPLLLIQGTADSIVPYSSSQTVYNQLSVPTYYVSLLGADHLPPIAGGTAWTPVLDASIAEFLDVNIADRGPGSASLAGTLAASPLIRLETKG
jgi:alpha-beta hydrolase superfamily lysophospholipase